MDISNYTPPETHIEYVAEVKTRVESVKQEAFSAMQYLEGWCSYKKAEVLMDLILLTKPNIVVEIGVFGGKSLIPMALALRDNGRGKIYGIDPWDSNESIKGMDLENAKWWKSVNHTKILIELFDHINHLDLQQHIDLIATTSEKAAPIRQIDILHIDGNHSFESSYHDVVKWVPMLKKGGMVILSDVSWRDSSTQKLVQSEAVKWLNANCIRKNIFRESSDWGIWVNPHDHSKIIDLNHFEKSVYSQNGEDGVTQKIFEVIGTSSKYYVEFGGFDGYTGSNAKILKEAGWDGLMLDGSFENLSINLRREFITAENINEIFEKYNVPYNLDFLSIDIDFNDFYVWKALDEKYKPRLIIVEYNATHLPNEDKVVHYDPMSSGDSTNYYGASILAFYNLAQKKGYSLVYADKEGVNLFFIRNDLIKKSEYKFKEINRVNELYMYPKYGNGPNGGHTQDPFFREYIKSSEILNSD